MTERMHFCNIEFTEASRQRTCDHSNVIMSVFMSDEELLRTHWYVKNKIRIQQIFTEMATQVEVFRGCDRLSITSHTFALPRNFLPVT
jgi:hypothetical protein